MTRASTTSVDMPVIYFPRRQGEPAEPVPFILTDADMVRLLRLDETGSKDPGQTLAYYRKQGLLRATQIGRCNRYRLPEVLEFVGRLDAMNTKEVE